MEKIQKNEINNGKMQSQKTTSDSDLREQEERTTHRPKNIFDLDMDKTDSSIHNEIKDISIDDIPQMSSVIPDFTPLKMRIPSPKTFHKKFLNANHQKNMKIYPLNKDWNYPKMPIIQSFPIFQRKIKRRITIHFCLSP